LLGAAFCRRRLERFGEKKLLMVVAVLDRTREMSDNKDFGAESPPKDAFLSKVDAFKRFTVGAVNSILGNPADIK
jgi:hypothetical protein